MRSRFLLVVIAACLFTALACSDESTQVSSPPPPTPTPYEGPLAAYAVMPLSLEPLSGLYLREVDPMTGTSVPDREPIELGHHGTWALSPDGATLALAWAPTGDSGDGPEQLFVVDTTTWEKRDLGYEGSIGGLRWSPDGMWIYVFASTYQCEDLICDSAPGLVVVEPTSGDLKSRVTLPFDGYPMHLSPDGQTLYFVGGQWYPETAEQGPQPARLIAFDIESGRVRDELVLRDVRYGQQREETSVCDIYTAYSPGTALSPDGRLLYIAHPDEDRITVVDTQDMEVARSDTFGQKQSLFDRFFSLFADTAHAKGGVYDMRALSVSPNGRFLYLTGENHRESTDPDACADQIENGLKVIDARTFEVVAEDVPADPVNVNWLQASYRYIIHEPSGGLLIVIKGVELQVRDPVTLRELSEPHGVPFYDFIVGPAPPTDR